VIELRQRISYEANPPVDPAAAHLLASGDRLANPSAFLHQDLRPQPRQNLVRKILMATDFSPASDRAVQCAVNLANQWNASLTILHVIDVNTKHTGEYPGGAGELMKRVWADGTARMGRLACSLTGQVEAQMSLEEGLPCEIIIERSAEFDLVILGNDRSKRGWKLFSQQTTQRVLENAFCPVMVV